MTCHLKSNLLGQTKGKGRRKKEEKGNGDLKTLRDGSEIIIERMDWEMEKMEKRYK